MSPVPRPASTTRPAGPPPEPRTSRQRRIATCPPGRSSTRVASRPRAGDAGTGSDRTPHAAQRARERQLTEPALDQVGATRRRSTVEHQRRAARGKSRGSGLAAARSSFVHWTARSLDAVADPSVDLTWTHEAVFAWVLERLAEADLVAGKTVGIDATTLEANAAMRSIERRDTGESHEAFIRRLAESSGVETPTRAGLARFRPVAEEQEGRRTRTGNRRRTRTRGSRR